MMLVDAVLQGAQIAAPDQWQEVVAFVVVTILGWLFGRKGSKSLT